MNVAPSIGLSVVEEPVTLARLFAADEVLLTSSLREVYSVRTIDGHGVSRGEVEKELREAYGNAVREALS
jgi:branched-subunit amino acid aminotransferase/4-amino-4-deoxychorismate lyase